MIDMGDDAEIADSWFIVAILAVSGKKRALPDPKEWLAMGNESATVCRTGRFSLRVAIGMDNSIPAVACLSPCTFPTAGRFHPSSLDSHTEPA